MYVHIYIYIIMCIYVIGLIHLIEYMFFDLSVYTSNDVVNIISILVAILPFL